MPVVTRHSPNKVQMMKWGLVPFWAKDAKIGYRMINAMAETVADKPAFRRAFASQRCLVPANGFYEWKTVGDTKTPYLFRDSRETYISFAGLYEEWKDANGGSLLTYTIITTKANATVAPVHARMPVILTKDEEEVWLSHESTKEELKKILDPYAAISFESYPVSDKVNSPANNNADLIRKIV